MTIIKFMLQFGHDLWSLIDVKNCKFSLKVYLHVFISKFVSIGK